MSGRAVYDFANWGVGVMWEDPVVWLDAHVGSVYSL